MRLATVLEIRRFDQLAIERYRIPESELMRRVGEGAAREVLGRFPHVRKVAIVIGKGKNGGDGRVVAACLRRQGITCLELETSNLPPNWQDSLKEAGLVIDALFGIGLARPVMGVEREMIHAINRSGKPVASLDIPSGLSGDTGRPQGVAVRASLTCTIGLPKVGLYMGDGPRYAGEVVCVDLGVPAVISEVDPQGSLLEPGDFVNLLRPRRGDTHKGTYGHLLIVGGSVNRLGAPLLAARAALRTGAGLVSVALPSHAYKKIPAKLLEVMYEPLPSNARGQLKATAWRSLRSLLKGKGGVVVGPGLGTSTGVRRLVEGLVREGDSPHILDADALNALGQRRSPLGERCVLTPHPGEMARLTGRSVRAVQQDRIGVATSLAKRLQCLVVLKGFRTIIVGPDGRYFVNPTGNPGMATAGMGDVLSGMIGALAGIPGTDLLQAVLTAVYLHGFAGDRVHARLGDRGLTASDVIEEIPLAFKELVERYGSSLPHPE